MRSKLASSIAILLNYGAKWRVLYYIFYVLCLDLELSIILDKNFLFSDLTSLAVNSGPAEEYIKSLSVLTKYLGYTVFWEYQPSNLALYFILLLILLGCCATLCFVLTDFPNKYFLQRSQTAAVLIAIMCTFSEYFVILTMGCLGRLVICKRETYFEWVDKNASSTSSIAIPAYWQNTESGLFEREHFVTVLTDQVDCAKSDFKYLIAISIATFVMSLLVWFIGQLLVCHRISRDDFPSRRILMRYFQFLLYFIIIAIKTLHYWTTQSFIRTDYYLFIVACLTTFGLVLQLVVKDYDKSEYSTANLIKYYFLSFSCFAMMYEREMLPSHNRSTSIRIIAAEALASTLLIKALLIFRGFFNVCSRKAQSTLQDRSNIQASTAELLETIEACDYYLWNVMHKASSPSAHQYHRKRLISSLDKFIRHNIKDLKVKPLLELNIRKAIRKFVRHDSFMGRENISIEDTLDWMMDSETEVNSKDKVFAFNCYPEVKSVLDTIADHSQLGLKRVIEIKLGLLEVLISKYSNQIYSLKVPFVILELYLSAQVDYLARVSFASYIIQLVYAECKSFTYRKMDLLILRETLTMRARQSLLTGNIILLRERPKLRFTTPQTNEVDLSRVMHYLLVFEKVKKTISEILALKIEVLEEGEKNQCFELAKLYTAATKLQELTTKADADFAQLKSLIDDRSTPVQLIFAFYQMHVKYLVHVATGILSQARDKKFSFGFRHLTDMEILDNHILKRVYIDKMVVISASIEQEDFHKIVLVTSNVSEHLGFSSTDLLGEDLSEVIPQPVKSKHRDFVIPKTSNSVLLESKVDSKLYVCKKNKDLRGMKLALRVGPTLDKGILMVGRMNFEGLQTAGCIAIFDQNMRISETTKDASEILERGVDIKKYSQNLASWIADYMRVCDLKMIKSPSELEYMLTDDLTSQEERIKLHRYIEMRRGVEVHLMDRRNIERMISIKIRELRIRAVQQNIFFMKIVVINSGSEKDLVARDFMLPSSEEGSRSVESAFISQSPSPAMEAMATAKYQGARPGEPATGRSSIKLDPTESPPKHSRFGPLTNLNSVGVSVNGRREIAQMSGVTNNVTKHDRTTALRYQSLAGEMQRVSANRLRIGFEHIKQMTSEKMYVQPMSMTKHPIRLKEVSQLPPIQFIKNDGVPDVPTEKGFQPKAKKRNSMKSETTSLRHNRNEEQILLSTIGRVLHKRHFEHSAKKVLWILFAGVYSLVHAHLVFESYSFFSNSSINAEISRKARFIDTASWAVWAVNSFTPTIQFSQAVHNGLIPDDYFADYSTPSVLEGINTQKAYIAGSLFSYTASVALEMRNLSLRERLPSDFFKSHVERPLRFPEFELLYTTGEVRYIDKLRYPAESVKEIIPFVLSFNSIIESVDMSGSVYEPESNWLAYILRYNMLHSLQTYTLLESNEMNAYVMFIATASKQWYSWYNSASGFLAFGILTPIIIVLSIFIIRSKRNLSDIISFKVAISTYSDLRYQP